ncbi:MAG: molybdopterin cofactor-binding domain-containing protein, partial [Dehalococcoidia bacterium]
MGFGHALFEEVVYQDGQLRNGDPFQYRLPVMGDIPDLFHSFMVDTGMGQAPLVLRECPRPPL